jgi:exonuclease III
MHPQTPNNAAIRANINIASLNMNGLSAPSSNMSFLSKWAMINTTLNKHKIAILALQETHLDQQLVDRLHQSFSDKMEIIFSPDPNSPRSTAGVTFVINKRRIAPKEWAIHEIIPGRALLLKIKWHESETTSLLNIYAPTHKPSHPPFWTKILDVHVSKHLPKPDFMLGDFNVTEDPIDRALLHADDQAAVAALRNLRLTWDLQDAWCHLHPNTCAFTYRATSNGLPIQLRLDRIYIANHLIPTTFDWKIVQSSVPTDHWMTSVKFAPNDAPFIGKGRWTWPLHTLGNDSLLEAISNCGTHLQSDLNNLRIHNTERSTSNPQLLWKEFKQDICEIAKKHSRNSYH